LTPWDLAPGYSAESAARTRGSGSFAHPEGPFGSLDLVVADAPAREKRAGESRVGEVDRNSHRRAHRASPTVSSPAVHAAILVEPGGHAGRDLRTAARPPAGVPRAYPELGEGVPPDRKLTQEGPQPAAKIALLNMENAFMITREWQALSQRRTGAECRLQVSPRVSLLSPSARILASLLGGRCSMHLTI
jgi:hypothetical protein